jgi:hypothetical protein
MIKKLFSIFLFLFSTLGTCDCIEFYHVKRPVAGGAVLHEYVGAHNRDSGELEVFGLLKGDRDIAVFRTFIAGDSLQGIEAHGLGTACDQNSELAVITARHVSQRWVRKYQNWMLYLARMGVTPVFGKPCRNAALEIDALIGPYLK